MKPQIVHRYSIPLAEVVGAFIDAGDCEKIDAVIVGENLVVEVIGPVGAIDAADFIEVETPPQSAAERQAPPPSDEAQKINRPEKPKGGPLAQRAAIICGEKGFWKFLSEKFGFGLKIDSADAAAAWLRERCGVNSRSEIDHNAAAADIFRPIESKYRMWLEGY